MSQSSSPPHIPPPPPPIRHSTTTVKPPTYLQDYHCHLVNTAVHSSSEQGTISSSTSKDIVIEYLQKITDLGFTIFELLSEALGLDPSYLKELNCAEGLYIQGHYYPPCPEPELTMGATKHTDTGFMTLVLQDQLGGLQILHEDKWVNVPPVHGALVVNMGDLLQ
ncbi:1-aminocyclopropane-1-carboxylate oxidase 1-like protein, partial [Trifolium pratense]